MTAHAPARIKPRKRRTLTREDLRELITRGMEGAHPVIAARDRAMLSLMASAPASTSEIVAADISDVRFTADGLLVSLYEDVTIPSTGAPETVEAVTEWITILREHGREDGPLFPRVSKSGVIGAPAGSATGGSADGRMIDRAVRQRLRLAADEAGLEGR